jgi:hypothetical protein
MEAEQLNEAITVNDNQLAHLWHIQQRVKNQGALTKHVLKNVNMKTYLSV